MVNSNGIETVVLKAKYGSDIRKRHIQHQNDFNYSDLVLMMQRIFEINPSEKIHLKYRDSDGDWITIMDDNDIDFALRTEATFFVEVSTGEGDYSCELAGGHVNGKSERHAMKGHDADREKPESKLVDGVQNGGKSMLIQDGPPVSNAPSAGMQFNGEAVNQISQAQNNTTTTSWSTLAGPQLPVSQFSTVNSTMPNLDSQQNKSSHGSSVATIQPSAQEMVGGTQNRFDTIYDANAPHTHPPANEQPPQPIGGGHGGFAPMLPVSGAAVLPPINAPTPPISAYQPHIGPQSGMGNLPPQPPQPMGIPPVSSHFQPVSAPTPPIPAAFGKQHDQYAYNTPLQMKQPGMENSPAVQPAQYGGGVSPAMHQTGFHNTAGFGPGQQQFPPTSGGSLAQPPTQFNQPHMQQGGPPPNMPPAGMAPPPVAQFGSGGGTAGNPFARGGTRPSSNFSSHY